MTAVAALLAAVSGLIGGLNQIGVFDRLKHPAPVTGGVSRGETASSTPSSGAPKRAPPVRRPAAAPPRHGATQPAPQGAPESSHAAPSPPAGVATPSTQPASSTKAPPTAGAPAPTPADSTRAATGQSPAPTADSTAAPAGPGAVISSGTALELAAQSRVCSISSRPGDHFTASVVVPVAGSTGVLVPAGSSAILEVTREEPPVFIGARADSLIVGGKAHPVTSTTTRTQREFVAGPGARGIGVGACIPAGGRITVTLTSPVSLGTR